MDSQLTSSEIQKLREIAKKSATDAAHGIEHCDRVAKNAAEIGRHEGGDLKVLVAAAYLHDIENFPKNHPKRKLSSELSAKKAQEILKDYHFNDDQLERAYDAILCHSFSRGATPTTLEGRIFQDADRLDSLGAIGIARTLLVGASFNAELYHSEDPFLESGREPDDRVWSMDHFYTKLLKLPEMMQTETGKRFAEKRAEFMKEFLSQMSDEIKTSTTVQTGLNRPNEKLEPQSQSQSPSQVSV